MDYTGLYSKKYHINRKLTAEERSNQLRQKLRFDIEPFYNLSVIRVNSTYLECVDRWFIYRGAMAAVSLLFFMLTIGIVMGPLYMFDSVHIVPKNNDLRIILFAIPFMAPLWVLLAWGLMKEAFCFTHYPIRFNFLTRKVCVFRRDGTVLYAKWDDLFFTLGRCRWMAGKQNWDIRGHVIDRDGETVLETFALLGDNIRIDQLKHIWEFVRRYMEEGPASVYRDVYWCHDVADRKEKYAAGLRYLFFSLNGQPIGQILLSPFFFLDSLGRWFAMRTSKIPVWPAEVEAECAVDPFDPYLRDASRNPEKIPMEPIRNK